MAKYRIEIWNKANTARDAIIPRQDLVKAFRNEDIEGVDTLSLQVNRATTHWATIQNEKIVRVYNLDDNTFTPLRIKQIEDARVTGNLSAKISAEHIKYDMIGEIYPRWNPFIQAAPSTIVKEILTESSFSLGTIAQATKIDIVLNVGTVSELIEQVRAKLNTDLIVNNDLTVSMFNKGSSTGARIRYAKNLQGIRRNRDSRDLYNQIFGVGAGEPPVLLGHDDVLGTEAAEHIITAISGATITAHSRLVSSDDSWNGFYLELTRNRVDDVASSTATIGVTHEIIDSIAGSQVVLTAAISGATVGDYFKIVSNAAGDSVDFIRDGVSITTHGTKQFNYKRSNIIRTRNLVRSGDLSGAFVDNGLGDIDENWVGYTTSGGSIAFAKSTNQNRIKFGKSSVHVTTADIGEGIIQDIQLEDNKYHSFWTHVYVSTGKVRFEIDTGDGSREPSLSTITLQSSQTGTFLQLKVEGIQAAATTTAAKIRIISNQANSDFYVDSVMVEKAAKSTSSNEFELISGARTLWDESFDQLQLHKAIRNKYITGVVDLFEANPIDYPYDQLSLGDTVTVQDDELGIDIDARIRMKNTDLLQSWNTKLEIDNSREKLSKQLTNQSRIIKNSKDRISDLMGRRTEDINSDGGGDITVKEILDTSDPSNKVISESNLLAYNYYNFTIEETAAATDLFIRLNVAGNEGFPTDMQSVRPPRKGFVTGLSVNIVNNSAGIDTDILFRISHGGKSHISESVFIERAVITGFAFEVTDADKHFFKGNPIKVDYKIPSGSSLASLSIMVWLEVKLLGGDIG